jgi:hypothetical protein
LGENMEKKTRKIWKCERKGKKEDGFKESRQKIGKL